MGGTGFDEIMLYFGDAIWFSDENGNPQTPPENAMTFLGGPVNEIENPNPQNGTNNWWTQDGYGGFCSPGTCPTGVTGIVYGGGSYTNCSDTTQPGVAPIVNYLQSLTLIRISSISELSARPATSTATFATGSSTRSRS
jgi:phospholipase C